ncbi:MAG: hypothetical protein HY348_10300, partial [Nitrospira defluvii]|nr:hypothetical protein [Nitrospira defluvii]
FFLARRHQDGEQAQQEDGDDDQWGKFAADKQRREAAAYSKGWICHWSTMMRTSFVSREASFVMEGDTAIR